MMAWDKSDRNKGNRSKVNMPDSNMEDIACVRKKSQRQGTAQGFTLMEVLIAIVVLAIVVLPTLAYFSNSTKYNVRTGSKHKATVAAERLMEEVLGTDSSSMISNLEDPDGTITNAVSGSAFTVTSSAAIVSGGSVRYVCTGQVEEGGSVFDAVVEIDPDAAMISSGASIHTINPTTDITFDEDSFTGDPALGRQAQALDVLAAPTNIINNSMTRSDIEMRLSKNIIFSINKIADGIYEISATVTYYVENAAGKLKKRTYSPAQDIAKETVDTNIVKNIYLLYQNYGLTTSNYKYHNDVYFQTYDNGVPTPSSNIDLSGINFYLVCQKADTMDPSVKNQVYLKLCKDESGNLGRGTLTFKNIYMNIPTSPSRVEPHNVHGSIHTSTAASDSHSSIAIVTVSLYKENQASSGSPYITLKTEAFYTE